MDEIIQKIIDDIGEDAKIWIPCSSLRPIEFINKFLNNLNENEVDYTLCIDRLRTWSPSKSYLISKFESPIYERLFSDEFVYSFESDPSSYNIIEYRKSGKHYSGQEASVVGKTIDNSNLSLAFVCFFENEGKKYLVSEPSKVLHFHKTKVVGLKVEKASLDFNSAYRVEDKFFSEVLEVDSEKLHFEPEKDRLIELEDWAISEQFFSMLGSFNSLYIGSSSSYAPLTYKLSKSEIKLNLLSDKESRNTNFLENSKYTPSSKVYNKVLKDLIDKGLIDKIKINVETLKVLLAKKVISKTLTSMEFVFLQENGIFKKSLILRDGLIYFEDGTNISSTMETEDNLNEIAQKCLGNEFTQCFSHYYTESIALKSSSNRLLKDLDSYLDLLVENDRLLAPIELDKLELTGSFELKNKYNDTENSLSRTDSCVYFLRSTFSKKGQLHSSITLKDKKSFESKLLNRVLITEYGIANLVNKNSEDAATEILKITDSRFQEELLTRAKKIGLIDVEYRLEEKYRHNYPEVLKHKFKDSKYPDFPLGHRYHPEELEILKVLRDLDWEHKSFFQKSWALAKAKVFAGEMPSTQDEQEKGLQYMLKRLSLNEPEKLKEEVYSSLFVRAAKSL